MDLFFWLLGLFKGRSVIMGALCGTAAAFIAMTIVFIFVLIKAAVVFDRQFFDSFFGLISFGAFVGAVGGGIGGGIGGRLGKIFEKETLGEAIGGAVMPFVVLVCIFLSLGF